MARVGDTARLTLKSHGIPDVHLTDDLTDLASATWIAARAAVEHTNGIVKVMAGKQGVEGQLSMHQIVDRLVYEADHEEARIISGMVRAVFKRAGVARCTDDGRPRGQSKERVTPTWWIADELPNDFQAHAEYVRDHGPHTQELRMIQDEARKHGRAREKDTPKPSEVTTTKVTDAPVAALEAVSNDNAQPETVFVSPRKGVAPSNAERKKEEYRARVEAFRLTTAGLPEPWSVEEAAVAHWGADHLTRTLSTARQYSGELLANGQLFKRIETREERAVRAGGVPIARRANLFWPTDPVPARTIREIVPGVRLNSSEVVGPQTRTGSRATGEMSTDALAQRVLELTSTRPAHAWSRKQIETGLKLGDKPVKRAVEYLIANDCLVEPRTGYLYNAGYEPGARTEEPTPASTVAHPADADMLPVAPHSADRPADKPVGGATGVRRPPMEIVRQHDQERADAILTVMRTRKPGTVWSQEELMYALGLAKRDRDRVLRSLKVLVDRGLAQRSAKHKSRRYVMTPAGAATPEPPALTGVVQPPSPSPADEAIVSPPPPVAHSPIELQEKHVPVGLPDDVDSIVSAIRSLAARTGAPAEELEALRSENEKLRAQVAALKATVATLL